MFDEFAGDRQSEAGTALGRRAALVKAGEPLEDVLVLASRNAGAIVLDGDGYCPRCR